MNIGKKIKENRKKSNMTQDDIAKKLYLSRKTISGWENNRSIPDIASIISLSKIFNLSIDDFLNDEMVNQYSTENKIYRINIKIMSISFIFNILLTFFSYMHLFRLFSIPFILLLFIFNIIILTLYSSYFIKLKIKSILISFPFIFIFNIFLNCFNKHLWYELSHNSVSYDYGLVLGNIFVYFMISFSLTLILFIHPRKK